MIEKDQIEVVPGEGIMGDRYFRGDKKYEADKYTRAPREITLISSEALDSCAQEYSTRITAAMLRRNLLTEGINLNNLVGKKFRVGEVELEGLELCEPCQHISQMNDLPLIKWMVHRAGLRARILNRGIIQKNDAINLV
jgi:MOSC domain-containing protein YiiM